jgi:hypothetical protein
MMINLKRLEETWNVLDQLFCLKWIDSETTVNQKGYSLEYTRSVGGDIYHGAVFQTSGFALKAQKIQLKDLKGRVKISVLSRIGP